MDSSIQPVVVSQGSLSASVWAYRSTYTVIVRSVTAGTGISVTGTAQFPVVSNSGVLSLTAGTGVSNTGTSQDPIVTNTGVLSVTAGNNITLGGTSQQPVINVTSPLVLPSPTQTLFTQLGYAVDTAYAGPVTGTVIPNNTLTPYGSIGITTPGVYLVHGQCEIGINAGCNVYALGVTTNGYYQLHPYNNAVFSAVTYAYIPFTTSVIITSNTTVTVNVLCQYTAGSCAAVSSNFLFRVLRIG